MDEFDIDVCLTGHDHTYSRSYQVLDGNVVDYDISSGTVADVYKRQTMYRSLHPVNQVQFMTIPICILTVSHL